MIIYMHKENSIGYIYAFFNGVNTYTCQCEVSYPQLEELYCSCNGKLPLEEYIRSHGSHIRRNSVLFADVTPVSPRVLLDKFQFLKKGSYIFDIKEVNNDAKPVSETQRYRQSWFSLLFRRIAGIPARQTRI